MRRKTKHFPTFWIIIILGLAIVLGSFLIADLPFIQVKTQALKVIKKKTNLSNFTEYYWYNRESSYFSALGQTPKNKSQYAIVDLKSGDLLLVDQDKGISENQAKKIVVGENPNLDKIQKVRLGVYKNKIVWEISFLNQKGELNYYTLAFKNGKILQKTLKI